MSDFIEIEIKNEKVQSLLKELLKKTSNLTPLMRAISETILRASQENFETEGRRLPSGWPGLSQVTKDAREERETWPGKILQESSLLFDSLSEDYGEDYASVGTNKIYAAIHQFGGPAGKNRKVEIPARPFLGLNDDDWEDIEDDVLIYLNLNP